MAHEHDKPIHVQIVTSSGNFPETGFKRFNDDEKLETVLKEAAAHLKLQNTGDWIARLGDKQLDPALSLEANHVPDHSKIFWAPPERGGGSEACIRK